MSKYLFVLNLSILSSRKPKTLHNLSRLFGKPITGGSVQDVQNLLCGKLDNLMVRLPLP